MAESPLFLLEPLLQSHPCVMCIPSHRLPCEPLFNYYFSPKKTTFNQQPACSLISSFHCLTNSIAFSIEGPFISPTHHVFFISWTHDILTHIATLLGFLPESDMPRALCARDLVFLCLLRKFILYNIEEQEVQNSEVMLKQMSRCYRLCHYW